MNNAAASEDLTDPLASEPLTPELALVDPELARYARDRLPDPGRNPFSRDDGDDARRAAHPVPAALTGDISTDGIARERSNQAERVDQVEDRAAASSGGEPARRGAGRAGWRKVALCAVGLLLAVAAFFALTPAQTDDEVGPVVHPTVPSEHAKKRQPRGKKRVSPTRPKALPTRVRTTPQTKRASNSAPKASVPSRAASKPAKKRANSSRASAFGSRVFIWPSSAHAMLYKVAFFRHGEEIFEALPSEPRLKLPLRWVYEGRKFRLTEGPYSWTVWPAFGPRRQLRYGKPIVQSTWVARR